MFIPVSDLGDRPPILPPYLTENSHSYEGIPVDARDEVGKIVLLAHELNASRDSMAYNATRVDKGSCHEEEARRLHARIYEQWGYVQPGQISPNGFLNNFTDPFVEQSSYFVVEEGDVIVASARQIGSMHSDFCDFQAFANTGLNPRDIEKLKKIDPAKTVEISGLVKSGDASDASTLHLFREMLRSSRKEGHQAWVMVVNKSFITRLELLFGKSITRIGPETPLSNLDMVVVPALLDVRSVFDDFEEGAREVQKLNIPILDFIQDSILRFFTYGERGIIDVGDRRDHET